MAFSLLLRLLSLPRVLCLLLFLLSFLSLFLLLCLHLFLLPISSP